LPIVAQNDFPNKIKRKDAKKTCASLGPGWRLPTQDELNTLDQNKNKIGGFGSDGYWSSPGEFGAVFYWHQNFVYGLFSTSLKASTTHPLFVQFGIFNISIGRTCNIGIEIYRWA